MSTVTVVAIILAVAIVVAVAIRRNQSNLVADGALVGNNASNPAKGAQTRQHSNVLSDPKGFATFSSPPLVSSPLQFAPLSTMVEQSDAACLNNKTTDRGADVLLFSVQRFGLVLQQDSSPADGVPIVALLLPQWVPKPHREGIPFE